jgi:26S proteasome non-ATPase regulatory subunit 9
MASESVSARERVTSLYAAREAMETEMASIAGRLSQPGAPGLKGPLVDKEGFPIPGVDLYAVRADRGRYAVLRNDHEAITAELALALAQATKEAGAAGGVERVTLPPDGRREGAHPSTSAPPKQKESTATSSEGEGAPAPFAVVDDVAAGSPASTAGFAVGDQVLRFGDVTRRGDEADSGETLARVAAAAAAAAAAAGAAAAVSVRRRGALTRLECFPRAWEGRGFLGCHMRPV